MLREIRNYLIYETLCSQQMFESTDCQNNKVQLTIQPKCSGPKRPGTECSGTKMSGGAKCPVITTPRTRNVPAPKCTPNNEIRKLVMPSSDPRHRSVYSIHKFMIYSYKGPKHPGAETSWDRNVLGHIRPGPKLSRTEMFWTQNVAGQTCPGTEMSWGQNRNVSGQKCVETEMSRSQKVAGQK